MADLLVGDQAVNPLVAELRAERDRTRGEADTLRQEMIKLRERIARLEGEAAGVRATAIADLAAVQADARALRELADRKPARLSAPATGCRARPDGDSGGSGRRAFRPVR